MTDIPTLRPPHETPPVTDLAALTEHWRALMGPLGSSCSRLWLLFLEADGAAVPDITTIDEIPARADPVGCENLAQIAAHVLAEGASFAVLLSRPGREPMNEADRSWARGLTAAAAALGVSMWPMHFANDRELRVFAPDDLVRTALE